MAAVGALLVAVFRFRERRGTPPARLVAGRGFFVRAGVPLAVVAIGALRLRNRHHRRRADRSSRGPVAAPSPPRHRPRRSASKGVPSEALQQAIERSGNTTPAGGPIGGAAKGGPLEIDAVAQQWLWRFFYPGGPGTSGAYSPTGGRPGNRTFSYTS